MHTFQELLKNAATMHADWIKSLAALSIAALTILISMMPEILPEPPANYFLAICWILLAICIPASFRPIIESKKLAWAAINLQQKPNAEGKIPGGEMTKKLHKQEKVLSILQYIAVGTFCLSFISLAIYATITVL